MKLENTIIYLIGIPAVGKYSTAKEIGRQSGARVVDSQVVNIPIFSIIGYDGTDKIQVHKEAWDAIGKIRRVVLDFIRDHADPKASFVFTNVLSNSPGDRRLFRRLERIAKTRGSTFVPVLLSCNTAELRRRKKNQDRRDRFKDIDLSNIRYWTEEFEQLEIKHANAISIDTTSSPPDKTGKMIIDHARRIGRR